MKIKYRKYLKLEALKYENNLSSSKNSKHLYRYIRNKLSTSNYKVALSNGDGLLETDDTILCEMFNKYYTSVLGLDTINKIGKQNILVSISTDTINIDALIIAIKSFKHSNAS